MTLPEACFPSPFCRCCECQGIHCLIPHPGHSHRYADDNETLTGAMLALMKGRRQMTVRAKFQVVEVTEMSWSKTVRKIVLSPMYDTSIPEDQRFAQATPSGRFEMTVDNPSAIAALPIGQQFYIDITPVPEPAKV